MAIDALHLTLQTLTNKNAALDRATTELKNDLTGDFAHDAPIQQQLAAMHAEQGKIASRLAAITSDQPFTPPTDSDVNALQAAINELDADIRASADLNAIMGDVATVLSQYGAGASQKPPQP